MPLAEKLATMSEKFADGLHVFRRRDDALGFLFETTIYWGINALGMWLLAWGAGVTHADGTAPTFGEACALMGMLGCAILIPGPPGLLGVFQAGIYAGMTMFFPTSIVTGPGAAYVFLMYASQVVFQLVLGAMCLMSERGGLRALEEAEGIVPAPVRGRVAPQTWPGRAHFGKRSKDELGCVQGGVRRGALGGHGGGGDRSRPPGSRTPRRPTSPPTGTTGPGTQRCASSASTTAGRSTRRKRQSGYILFDYKSPEGAKTSPGSIELVKARDPGAPVSVLVQLPQMPHYHEQVLLDSLATKMRREYGDPPIHRRPDPAPDFPVPDAGSD